MYKLPIKNILTDSFLIPWNERIYFLNALTLPILVLVSAWGIWAFVKPENQLFNYGFLLLYYLAFCYFAVTCHRLILLKDKAQNSYNTIRIMLFLKWVVIIYGISLVVEMIALTIAMNVTDDFKPNNIIPVRNFLYLPLMYFVGRVSLIFPATAIDLKASLKWSWNATRNNGINILCVVGLLPWFMYMLLDSLYRANPTIIEQALIALLTYIVTAIGVFALSLTYKELELNAQKQL